MRALVRVRTPLFFFLGVSEILGNLKSSFSNVTRPGSPGDRPWRRVSVFETPHSTLTVGLKVGTRVPSSWRDGRSLCRHRQERRLVLSKTRVRLLPRGFKLARRREWRELTFPRSLPLFTVVH